MTEGEPSGVDELTYPLGAAARLTGLTPDLLRAWERRYGVVTPLRTPGGTRRYRASDLDRLRLVKSAVDAGYRISEVARLDAEELAQRIASHSPPPQDPMQAVMLALDALDVVEAERVIALQLAALGPVHFAKTFAVPLLRQIGVAWQEGRLCVASEHLASGVLRSLLGASLRASHLGRGGSRIVFSTLPGERHEIGLLIAALVASGAGGQVVYLGPDLPLEELVGAMDTSAARALALSIVTPPPAEVTRQLAELRAALPPDVELWIGGAGAEQLPLPAAVTQIDSLESLEQRVQLLGIRPSSTA